MTSLSSTSSTLGSSGISFGLNTSKGIGLSNSLVKPTTDTLQLGGGGISTGGQTTVAAVATSSGIILIPMMWIVKKQF